MEEQDIVKLASNDYRSITKEFNFEESKMDSIYTISQMKIKTQRNNVVMAFFLADVGIANIDSCSPNKLLSLSAFLIVLLWPLNLVQ